MGSKMANSGPHAAGIFADMTVDGPEIGTLVLVVDRAKNLPNRKTMGKQNPYCAARLGKEARKTETDQRGGQTPKWDQELRFTVHDSPDYYQLKISVFSEDKRTDLIGEAWVSLEDVVVPGGGKSDVWQGLNCKGKYAGEIRIELTYYDTREKPEKAEHIVSVAEELQQTYGGLTKGVKRRPLPVNPNAPNTTPVIIPDRAPPGRARHGPRDFATPPRAASLPPEGPKTYNYPHSQTTLFGNTPVNGGQHGSASVGASPVPVEQSPQEHFYGEYDPNPGQQPAEPPGAYMQPDFLPTLGPGRRERGPAPPQSMPPQQRYAERPPPPAQQYMDVPPAPLPHSHSAPAVPSTHDYYPPQDDTHQPGTDHPVSIPDVDYQYQQVRQRRHDMPSGWEQEYRSPRPEMQAYVEDEVDNSPPPPPPAHSHSSPAVPQYGSAYDHPHGLPTPGYGATPPSARQQYIPGSSPLQSIERTYGQQQTPPNHRHPARTQTFDDHDEVSPYQNSYGSAAPNTTPPHQPHPPSQGRNAPFHRPHPTRHSLQDPWSTPSRPHPLSQEVPRARSPHPYGQEPPPMPSPYQQDYRGHEAAPLIKPRAISPRPEPEASQPVARRRSSYNIQHPVRAFESSDESPLSTSQQAPPQQTHRGSLPRKSVSPRPWEGGRPEIPFSPESFGVHNPNAPPGEISPTRAQPIVGWHGQERDPSDHLPVNSWAPEPEKKTASKAYGLGRDRDFGPRSQSGVVVNTAGRVSKDTIISVRTKPHADVEPEAQPPKIRARIVQKPGVPMEPLRDHHNFNPIPNPYEQQQQQQQQYSRGGGFREGSPAAAMAADYQTVARYDRGYGPPSIPPKVPLQEHDYGPDALSREISGIDIGGSRRGPAPTAFIPVRSHRDRSSYY